tara:strand:- start:402 stop:833 length:432 start_codon:yes stop_codon:yes gene_type:complete
MKKLIYNITLSLCLIFACNSVDPEPEPDDPLDIQANLLNGKWILKDESSAVKDGSIISDFKDLTLTFSGGTKSGGNYATINSIDVDVWPNSGSWQFQNNDKSKLLRSDNVVMSISVTQTTLRTSFTVVGGLKEGNWIFDFIKE